MRVAVALLSAFLPWRLRRRLLGLLGGFELHETSRIGFSLVLPRQELVLGEGARIGHLNVIWNLDRVLLGRESRIGHMNWISAIKTAGTNTFDEYPDRRPGLEIGEGAGITQRHYMDCSDTVSLGDFSLIGGVRSTVLCHHMNVHSGRQGCAPVRVGSHSMVSTNCVLLGGAVLPHHSILGAHSLLIKEAGPPLRLYVGSPAVAVKEYPEDLAWFQHTSIRTH